MPTAIERQPLTEEQKKLIEDNLPFIYWWFNLYHIYDEDRQQDYLYSICRFIHLYDPSRGSIGTFLRAILTSRRSNLQKFDNRRNEFLNRNSIRLDEVVFSYEDEDLTWADILGDTDEQFDKFEHNEVYKTLLRKIVECKKINPNQFKVFLTYINTGNQSETARMCGVSRQRVNQTILKVRNHIKNNDWI